ncbi:hypothetical protein ALC57_11828 [Trachymyrmex cornetzi]|uniref:GIY-YIG domain-containing protein n=1 Tax=Trachymyrmex cornetzi TaxID=471704 RepID=A0A151J1S6_9HYME|nr:hypothetical protein ALC57_11828 [Trachymyrmex cornetzi]
MQKRSSVANNRRKVILLHDNARPYVTKSVKQTLRELEWELKNPGLKMAYRGIHKLSSFIKVQKDSLQKTSQTDVVYRINCKECDASYVGQTSKCVKIRMAEHRNHINRNTSQSSVITEHRLQTSHDFDWDNIKILDKESIWNKRLLSEMIHIKKQKHGLNLQNDTHSMDPLYDSLFTKT